MAEISRPISVSAYSPKPANTSICRANRRLLVVAERRPVLDLLGLGREHRVGRHDAQRLLARERLLANLVPALVELASVFLDPFLRHMVRRMRRAGREIDEEGLVRRQRLLRPNPVDCVVGHVGHEVVAGIERRVDPRHVLDRSPGPTGSSRRRGSRRTCRSRSGSASGRSGPETLSSQAAVSWLLPKAAVE